MLPKTAVRTVEVWSWIFPVALGLFCGKVLVSHGYLWSIIPLILVLVVLNSTFRQFIRTLAVYAEFEKHSLPKMLGRPLPEEWTGDLVRPAVRQILMKPRGGNQWSLYHWIERNGPPWTHWIMRHVLGCKHFGEPLRMLPRPHSGEVRTWWEHDKVRRSWYVCRQEIQGDNQAELMPSSGGPIRGKTIDELHVDDVGPMDPPLKPGEEFAAKQRIIGAYYRMDARKDETTEFGFPPPFQFKEPEKQLPDGSPNPAYWTAERINTAAAKRGSEEDCEAEDLAFIERVNAIMVTPPPDVVDLETRIGERLKRFVGRPGSAELRKEIIAELMSFVPAETDRPMEDRVDDLMDICAKACTSCDRAEAEKVIRAEDARMQEAEGRMVIVDEPRKP